MSDNIVLLIFEEISSETGLPIRSSTVSRIISRPVFRIKTDTIIPITPSIGKSVNREETSAIIVALVAITSLRLSSAVAARTPECIFFPSFELNRERHSFTPIEIISETSTIMLKLTGCGSFIFFADSLNNSNPTITIIADNINEVRYSTLPWPNGWFDAILHPRKVTMHPPLSERLLNASEIIEIEPESTPIEYFNRKRKILHISPTTLLKAP